MSKKVCVRRGFTTAGGKRRRVCKQFAALPRGLAGTVSTCDEYGLGPSGQVRCKEYKAGAGQPLKRPAGLKTKFRARPKRPARIAAYVAGKAGGAKARPKARKAKVASKRK
jgi:hypothetical protein